MMRRKTATKAVFIFNLSSFLIVAAAALPTSAEAQKRVEVQSPEALLDFFDTLNYTPEAWEAGIRAVPRVYVMKVGKDWRVNSRNITVINKKRLFFRALGPLVLRANELVLADRARLLKFVGSGKAAATSAPWLRKFAVHYRVIKSTDGALNAEQLEELVRRVDVVPPSLVLAQGAEESGWGTSRFAAEGNALFGQWTWGGKGIKPKGQRKGMGDYRIAAFDTPLESVRAYIRNINTHPAYEPLRKRRSEIREARKPLNGWALAEMLTNYSERGDAYVHSLHSIMRVNKLSAADEARFESDREWHVYPAKK